MRHAHRPIAANKAAGELRDCDFFIHDRFRLLDLVIVVLDVLATLVLVSAKTGAATGTTRAAIYDIDCCKRVAVTASRRGMGAWIEDGRARR